MKTTSQRIQRILSILNKAALVLCGILFVWQGVVEFFLKDPIQEFNNELARSQQLLQHSNNHNIMGVLSEEGEKGPSPTRPDADEIEVTMKQGQNVIIPVLGILIVGLMGMGVFPPASGDSSRGVEIKNTSKLWMGVVLIIKNTSKLWMEVPRIIKNILIGFVGVILFLYEFFHLPSLFMAVIEAFFIIIFIIIGVLTIGLIVGLIGMAMFPKMVKDILKRVKGVKGLLRIIRNIFVVLVGLVLLWRESSDMPSLRIPMMLAFFIIGILMLVYTFLYFYYDHRDSVHGGYGELRDRMKVKISKINEIAKLMFCFCSTLVILSGLGW
jgi:hypothetical protein